MCMCTSIYPPFCCCVMDAVAIYIQLCFCDTPVSVLERALLPSTVLNEQWNTCTGFYQGKSAVPTACYAFSYACLAASFVIYRKRESQNDCFWVYASVWNRNVHPRCNLSNPGPDWKMV